MTQEDKSKKRLHPVKETVEEFKAYAQLQNYNFTGG